MNIELTTAAIPVQLGRDIKITAVDPDEYTTITRISESAALHFNVGSGSKVIIEENVILDGDENRGSAQPLEVLQSLEEE